MSSYGCRKRRELSRKVNTYDLWRRRNNTAVRGSHRAHGQTAPKRYERFPYIGVVVHRGNQVLDQRLQGRRNQAVVMVTHLPVAGGDGTSVKPPFRRDGIAPARMVAAAAAAASTAAAAAMAVRSPGTGSAVLPRAVRLRRRVRVLAAVVTLPHRRRGDGRAAVRAVGLRRVVGVFRRAVGAVVDVFLGGIRAGAVAVRAVRRRTVAVVGVRAELSGVRGCGRHGDLQRRRRRGQFENYHI